ncbi:MAG: helix-turn-helix transcriptional regulator [Dialister sp.]|uniref:helix-turn-helix domain-containing protein n=1 Tax=Dialister sp. TaxID=1955814 RepID=UPI001DAD36A0|nr:helix-turn-helix transcriptional regulator [Dialister sp.]MBS6715405.1 helix-turn-helix transcriptional regulator [Dialister sp.]
MNCPELRASIARAGITNRKLAEHLGLSEQAFYNKIQGDTEFKGSEIKRLAKVLNLSMKDVNTIFFDRDVN